MAIGQHGFRAAFAFAKRSFGVVRSQAELGNEGGGRPAVGAVARSGDRPQWSRAFRHAGACPASLPLFGSVLGAEVAHGCEDDAAAGEEAAEEGDDPVAEAGDADRAAFPQGAHGRLDDLFGRLRAAFLEPAGDAGDLEQFGSRGAGADGHHVDAVLAGFGPERFAQVQAVGLRRGVRGHVGDRLEAGQRGDINDGPAAALDHLRECAIGQLGNGHRVDADEFHQPVERRVFQFGDDGEPGVVDQNFDLNAELFDPGPQFRGAVRLRQVERDDFRFGRMAAVELLGQFAESVFPPGGQHQMHPSGRERARELGADSG